MSSYYTAAQLEAMRIAKLKQELSDTIQKLQAQMREEHQNIAHTVHSDNVVVSVTQEDIGSSGYSFSGVIADQMTHSSETNSAKRNEADFSGLLAHKKHTKTKLEIELEQWIGKIDSRPILTEDDATDHERLVTEIERIRSNKSLDIEDEIQLIRTRVQSYLLGSKTVSAKDKEQIESDYYQYCALCRLADEEAVETVPFKVRQEIARLTTLLEKRKQNEYISTALSEIMSEVGCSLKSNVIMDHVEGQLFEVDGQPLCDVFVGVDGSGIMFEPVVDSRSGSIEKQRRIENSVNSICAKYAKVEELAAKRGIILKRVYMEPASLETVCLRESLSESETKKKAQRKAQVKKERYMTTEG